MSNKFKVHKFIFIKNACRQLKVRCGPCASHFQISCLYSSENMHMVKVKLFLCLIDQVLRYEDIWGSGGIAPPFLTLALYVRNKY
jgi:hypothetical protein